MTNSGRKRTSKARLALGSALAACAFTAALVPSAAAQVQPFIVGGHDSTEEYPFMVSLQGPTGEHSCGGSLIKKDWVVTAGHCVLGKEPGEMQVRIGSADRTTGGTVAGVSEAIPHPEFDPQNFDKGFDVALLKLDKQVPQEPIRIAPEAGPAGTPTRIIGWGATCDDRQQCPEPPLRLQEVGMNLVPAEQCDKINAERELCIDGQTEGTQACNGDSGGPQLKGKPGEWELIGATSRDGDNDPKCGTGTGVYTDVTTHRDWIDQQTAA